jgi:hypothetical protein
MELLCTLIFSGQEDAERLHSSHVWIDAWALRCLLLRWLTQQEEPWALGCGVLREGEGLWKIYTSHTDEQFIVKTGECIVI